MGGEWSVILGLQALSGMLSDISYGFRQFRRNKLMTAVVTVFLMIGIGASTLIFSIVDALLLKPLPVRNPGNLYLIAKKEAGDMDADPRNSYRQFEQLSKRTDLFSGVLAEQKWDPANLLPFGDGRGVRLVMPQIVSPNYFQELGIQAVVGRVLTKADASASSRIPVVLSYQFWQSAFDCNPDILGRTIRLGKYPFLVVGVLPREFHSMDIERAPEVRLPISAAPVLTGQAADSPADNWLFAFHILVRLAPGVSPWHAAAAALPSMLHEDERYFSEWNRLQTQPRNAVQLHNSVLNYWITLERMTYGTSRLRGQFSQALHLLTSAVLLLLALVCANISGLLLAKGQERRKDLAVRLSLGASRAPGAANTSREFTCGRFGERSRRCFRIYAWSRGVAAAAVSARIGSVRDPSHPERYSGSASCSVCS